MAHDRPWRRKIGNALAALVVTLLVFGPGLDGLICNDDFGPVAAAAAAEMVVADSTADSHAPVDRDGCGPSIHCHCHHGPSHVAVVSDAAALSDATGEARLPTRERPAVLDRQFQLIRPPRA
jgi:hypothetical protein